MRENDILTLISDFQYGFDLETYKKAVGSSDFIAAENAYRERDFKRSFEYYKKMPAWENPFAATRLALQYYYGEWIKRDTDKAYELFLECALNGCPLAACWVAEYKRQENLMGPMYVLSSKIFENALPALKEMADAGDMHAEYFYAYNLIFGIGTEKDEEEAFKYLVSAYEKGSGAAAVRLAWCYFTGTGTKFDPVKTQEFLIDYTPEEKLMRHYLKGASAYRGEGR